MNRRLIAPGEFWHGASARALSYGFRNLGWCVEDIELTSYMPRASRTLDRAVNRLLRKRHEAAYTDAILRAADLLAPDAMLTVKGVGLTPATLSALRDRRVLTANYYPDVEFRWGGVDPDVIKAFDLIVTTKSYHVAPLGEWLGAERVAFVHHGFSPLVHRPVDPPRSEDDFDYDILYVGNAFPTKFEQMLAVAKAFPRLRIKIVGYRWQELARGTALEPFVLGYGLTGDFYARVTSRSKISIAVHSGAVTPGGNEDKVSTRTFEIPACGGFMLHVDNDELRSVFEVGHECASFTGTEALIEQIRYYLDHPAERTAIAAAGRARALAEHSYYARAAAIEGLIAARLG